MARWYLRVLGDEVEPVEYIDRDTGLGLVRRVSDGKEFRVHYSEVVGRGGSLGYAAYGMTPPERRQSRNGKRCKKRST